MSDLWPHQEQTITQGTATQLALDVSDPGCVSADTEFLTPTGWKRIDTYTPGDFVAQFDPATRAIEWVLPIAYVRAPCSQLIAISPVRGTSQRVSAEHRVLYYTPDGGYDETSALEFMIRLHRKGANHSHRKFATTFTVSHNESLALPDAHIRLMVAVIADGHFPYAGAKCAVRLKKQRKIDRLEQLLTEAKILYAKHQCSGQSDFQVFRFRAPREEKEFTPWWWGASSHQLQLIADEAPHWDGSERRAGSASFCSIVRASSDFIQYASAASGHTASLAAYPRADGKPTSYVVHVSRNKQFTGPGRASAMYFVDNPEGYKYCFSVPTTYWLARHNGHIFATGNTGKTRGHLAIYARRQQRKRCLVVCPKTLMKSAWGNEIQEAFPTLSFSLATAEKRLKAFQANTDVVITNTDAAVGLLKNKEIMAILKEQFDHLIIDEASAYKHRTSQRSKAMGKIVRPFQWRFLLTATPNPNSVTELWHPAFLLDGGERLGNNFFKFRNAVQVPTQIGPQQNHLRWDDRPGVEMDVFALMEDILIRHAFEEVMTHVPPNHKAHYDIELSSALMKQYKQLEATSILELKETVNAVRASSLRNKLLQLCCIAEDTLVLCESGWKPIQAVRNERVWDGEEWVSHDGLALQGIGEVIEAYGVWMTPDHQILTDTGWRTAEECISGQNSAGFDRAKVWLPGGSVWHKIHHPPCAATPVRMVGEIRTRPVYDLVNCGPRSRFVVQDAQGQALIVHNSGAVYHSEGEYTVLDRSRYALIADLIAERAHSVVFFNWKHQRDELVAELTRRDMYFAVIDGDTPSTLRDDIVAAYQKGYYQTLLLHPRTGAHGLTLTRGTTTIVSSPIYEADLLKQAIYRIYRGDQNQITNTILVRAKGTVEEFVYQRLDDKTLRMEDFLQLVTQSKEQV